MNLVRALGVEPRLLVSRTNRLPHASYPVNDESAPQTLLLLERSLACIRIARPEELSDLTRPSAR